MKVDLRITQDDYNTLYNHLFPGDGKESIGLALCGRLENKSSVKLLVHKVVLIPVEDCLTRTEVQVKWSTKKLIDLLEIASTKDLAILKIHSHPTGFNDFSETDSKSDIELYSSIFGWMDNDKVHGSAIMLPDGEIFGRTFNSKLEAIPFNKVLVVGDNIRFYNREKKVFIEEFSLRTMQAFGQGTVNKIRQLSVAVVGCSGTGSPTIEQLARLGFGKIILVDPDVIEVKNLNRILNSTMQDAISKTPKVDVIKKAIVSMGLETEVEAYCNNAFDSIEIIKAIADCDLIFGCVDSIDGRHLLNQIATFYLVPYFDLGVKLIADGKGGIEQIWSTVNYLQPGKSSLLTRGVYSAEDLRAASMFRNDPTNFENLKKEGYIKNVQVESPAVISINMQISSLAVIEFLARIHRFRYDENSESAITRISISDGYIQKESEGKTDEYLKKFVGRGDCLPFLNMPELN